MAGVSLGVVVACVVVAGVFLFIGLQAGFAACSDYKANVEARERFIWSPVANLQLNFSFNASEGVRDNGSVRP